MKLKSIYQSQSHKTRKLFSEAPAERILVVALDFARDQHVALLCNGLGEQLLKPFAVHNNRAGIEFLNQQIDKTRGRLDIDQSHVLIGGEDDPPYALNFLWALHSRWLVLRVNAHQAKQQRENFQASTDQIDLLAIAKTLINRQSVEVFESDEVSDPCVLLKTVGRDRDALVRDQTRLSNRIHAHVKILFPGFLNEAKDNPMPPFSVASLSLMAKEDFCAATYAGKKVQTLARTLKKLRITKPEEKAATLIQKAKQALPAPSHLVQAQRSVLQTLINVYQAIREAADQLHAQQAALLVRSPAAMLTTLSGIGVITASAITGELGSTQQLGSRAQLCSYAGIVPRVKQTGGPKTNRRAQA